MAYTSGLKTSSNGYQYFSCPGTAFVSIQVFNAGVDIGFGKGFPAASYPPNDEYVASAAYVQPADCDEIRFKSHVAGTPAQISIRAQSLAEVPADRPLGASITPSYLTVDPTTGAVSADFSGHVHALGLDIDASTELDLPIMELDNVVQWTRPDDDRRSAYLWGRAWDSAIPGSLLWQLRVASTYAGNDIAWLELEHINSPVRANTARIGVRADGGFTAPQDIIRGDLTSDYARRTTVLFNETPGPLPISANYTPLYPGRHIVRVAGSAFANAIGVIQVNLNIAGVGAVGMPFFANAALFHVALVPSEFIWNVAAGQVNVAQTFTLLVANPNTATDLNDHYTLTVSEIATP